MAAKVTFKSMDYFKFRKYVIDKDESFASSCSKEVASLCSNVAALHTRNENFDDRTDVNRLEEVFVSYKQILSFKRVECVDVRLKSGWWGDQKSGLSVGKVKPTMLREVLLSKHKAWLEKSENKSGKGASGEQLKETEKAFDGAGVFVFKHKERNCFQQVFSCPENIFARCAELFKSTYDGSSFSTLSSLLIISLANEWDFYFLPSQNSAEILRVLENDTLLRHDSLWPHGLNLSLCLESPFDIRHFRTSCVRHNWPPERTMQSSSVPRENAFENIQLLDPSKPKPAQKSHKVQSPTPPSPTKNDTNISTSSTNRPNSAKTGPGQATSTSIQTSNVKSPQASGLKSPQTSRPSTAQPRIQKPEEKTNNGTFKKEFLEGKNQPVRSKQEADSMKEKRSSRSFQSLKKDSSINDMQTSSKSEGKTRNESSQRFIEDSEHNVSALEKESKRLQSNGVDEVKGTEESLKGNFYEELEKDDDFFEIKPLKRSNTFTFSDTEEEKPNNDGNLTSRAVMAAKKINS